MLSSNDEGDFNSTLTEQNINQTESIATADGSEPLDFEPPLTSTPQKSKKPRASENISGKSYYVSVKVHWKNQESSKILPDDLESLGKMLCRETYTQIARAAWRCQRVREQVVVLFLKDIDRECSNICSKKNPSILRRTSKEDIVEFSLNKLDCELKKRTPLLRSVLKVQSVTKLVERSGVNGSNAPFPHFQCCKIKNCILFHVNLGCNALSIVIQQIYTTGEGGLIRKIAQLFTITGFWA